MPTIFVGRGWWKCLMEWELWSENKYSCERKGLTSIRGGVHGIFAVSSRTTYFVACGLAEGLSCRMKFSLSVRAMILLCAVAAMTGVARAGPMPPCVTATLSANSRILVVNDLTYDDQDETHNRHTRTSTFRVFRRYVDPNEGFRLNGPDTYWSDPLWSVVFANSGKPPFLACSYTLVTDDGEYLILVGNVFQEAAALSIYRRRDHPGQPLCGPGPDHGVLVRQIPLLDLWPPDQIPKTIIDVPPQWFASGTFAFSPDNRTLIHKTRWGKTLQISLVTGDIKSQ